MNENIVSKKTMRASILKEYTEFSIEEVPIPQITEEDDVIIRVMVCSICGTDVALSRAPSPRRGDLRGRILGHEIVGEIEAVGNGVKSLKVGDRVVVNPNSYCGTCHSCRSGFRNHCENMELMGITVPGGFAEYVKTKEFLTFSISREIPLNQAAFAEPLACVMNGFSRLDITPGDTCVVFGCGPIGLLFAQLARNNGARVACIEPKEKRQEIARQLGFEVYSPGADVKKELSAKWGCLANYCIDAAGGQISVALDYAEYRGRILCFAPSGTQNPVDLSPIQAKEVSIKGSYIIYDTMPRAIAVLESGILNLDPMITHVLELEDLKKGIDYMKSGEGMEVIININRK